MKLDEITADRALRRPIFHGPAVTVPMNDAIGPAAGAAHRRRLYVPIFPIHKVGSHESSSEVERCDGDLQCSCLATELPGFNRIGQVKFDVKKRAQSSQILPPGYALECSEAAS